MKRTFFDFWRKVWDMAGENNDTLDNLALRTLWKETAANTKNRQYREKKIKDTIYCVTTSCEGTKDIDKIIEDLAIRNVNKN